MKIRKIFPPLFLFLFLTLLGMIFIPEIVRPLSGTKVSFMVYRMLLYTYMTFISSLYAIYYAIRVILRTIFRKQGKGPAGKDEQKSDIIKMVLFLILGMTLAVYPVTIILLSNNLRNFQVSPRSHECIDNLRQIDQAKAIFELDHGTSGETAPTWDDLVPAYCGKKPVCPEGGEYNIGAFWEAPTCSLGVNSTENRIDDHILK